MASLYGVILGTYLVLRFSLGEWKALNTADTMRGFEPVMPGRPSNDADASTTVEAA
jgi:hypothetical protein